MLDEEEAKRFTEHESMKTKFDEQQSTDVTLAECLQLFEERETLGKDNMWYCSTCKEHVRASKQLQIWTLPEVLIVHLKRFSQGKWNVNKLTAMVDFPLEGLDLKEFVHGPVGDASTTYDLFGVSNHMGGLGGGHCWCCRGGGVWSLLPLSHSSSSPLPSFPPLTSPPLSSPPLHQTKTRPTASLRMAASGTTLTTHTSARHILVTPR